MFDLFTRLPGAVAALVGAHIMAFLLAATIGAVLAWVVVFWGYQAHQARRDRQASAHRKLPGSLPGDHH